MSVTRCVRLRLPAAEQLRSLWTRPDGVFQKTFRPRPRLVFGRRGASSSLAGAAHPRGALRLVYTHSPSGRPFTAHPPPRPVVPHVLKPKYSIVSGLAHSLDTIGDAFDNAAPRRPARGRGTGAGRQRRSGRSRDPQGARQNGRRCRVRQADPAGDAARPIGRYPNSTLPPLTLCQYPYLVRLSGLPVRCLSRRQTRCNAPDLVHLNGRTHVQNRSSEHIPTLGDTAGSGLLIRRFWVRVPGGVHTKALVRSLTGAF